LGQNAGQIEGRPRPGKVGHKNAETPPLVTHPKRTPNPKLKIFFDSELEELVNPWRVWTPLTCSSWRVINKRVPATILVGATIGFHTQRHLRKKFRSFPTIYKAMFGYNLLKTRLHTLDLFLLGSAYSLFLKCCYLILLCNWFSVIYYVFSTLSSMLSLRHAITRLRWILLLSCCSRHSLWRKPTVSWL